MEFLPKIADQERPSWGSALLVYLLQLSVGVVMLVLATMLGFSQSSLSAPAAIAGAMLFVFFAEKQVSGSV